MISVVISKLGCGKNRKDRREPKPKPHICGFGLHFANHNRNAGGAGFHFKPAMWFAVNRGFVNITNMPRLVTSS
jgi:hypothetical protein